MFTNRGVSIVRNEPSHVKDVMKTVRLGPCVELVDPISHTVNNNDTMIFFAVMREASG